MAHAGRWPTRGTIQRRGVRAGQAIREHGARRAGPPSQRRRALRAAVLLLLIGAGLGAAVWLMIAVMARPYVMALPY